ncbi:MAG: hypothetical protein KF726_10245 [Anaerolineae bacterium]|nr:hypothetical protein [Anaerolineae bacterium]
MTTVYPETNAHVSSIFEPTTVPETEKFEARVCILGRRLERYINGCHFFRSTDIADLDEAVQLALIGLWQEYQQHPWIMDLDDHFWLKYGARQAQNSICALIRQRGKRTSNGLRRFEFPATSLESEHDERDGLEKLEHLHFRQQIRCLRPESDQADRRLDLLRLVEQALGCLTKSHAEAVRRMLPFMAEGYLVKEAGRRTGVNRGTAQRAWSAFCQACTQVSGEQRRQGKGKGSVMTGSELDEIRRLAGQGLSISAIAAQLDRSENFVKCHFKRATGYQRLSNSQRNPITSARVAEMKSLRAEGMSISAIAKRVGCSMGSVSVWLNR